MRPPVNAAAEFSDPGDPVRTAADAHRPWMLDEFASVADEAGAADPGSAARQLMLVRDGAMVNGCLGEPDALSESLAAALRSVLGSMAA